MADLDDLRTRKGLEYGQDEGVLADLGPGLAALPGLALPEAFGAPAALGGHQPGLAGPGLQAAHQALGQVGGRAGRGLELQDPGPKADRTDEALDVELEGDVPLGVDQGDQVLEGLQDRSLPGLGLECTLGRGLGRALGSQGSRRSTLGRSAAR